MHLIPPQSSPAHREGPLSEADAVDIWIARWLKVRRKDILARYGCDPRRLYDIWEESRYRGSREKAIEIMRERHPELIGRIDTSPHRRIPRPGPTEGQASLLDLLR